MSGSFVKGAVIGFVCALLGGATVALAGSGVGGVFNLGVTNAVNGQTKLTGATSGAQLRVDNTSAASNAAGIAVTSASPTAAGFFAANTAGGPAGAFTVNAGVSPFTVSSTGKVANLNADRLDGLDSARFWNRGGNAGTSPGTDFLGTSDNHALELKVNGQRALRIEPGSSPNLIGGYAGNAVKAGAHGATIAGGGEGGLINVVTDDFGTVGGGEANVAGDQDGVPANEPWATIGGGLFNTASAYGSVVGGGRENTTSGPYAVIAGGVRNAAAGSWATVAGGASNAASGEFSFAAGYRAKANDPGAFVWADSTDADFASTAADQFLVRAGGGAKIVRGANSFAASNAALQVEQAQSGDAVAWLRMASAASTFPVVSLIKQGAGTGDFLRCFDEAAGPVFSPKCHIDKDGTYTAGSDFAESLAARGGQARYSPGDVLRITRTRAATVELADRRFDRALIGVYSTRPAVLGADKGGVTRVDKGELPVAITGIVPVKVTAENGPIRPGDLLTTSSTPGRAMYAGTNPPVGTVLGKALGFLAHGQGVIKMLVLPR
jgi:hypothetical protein